MDISCSPSIRATTVTWSIWLKAAVEVVVAEVEPEGVEVVRGAAEVEPEEVAAVEVVELEGVAVVREEAEGVRPVGVLVVRGRTGFSFRSTPTLMCTVWERI